MATGRALRPFLNWEQENENESHSNIAGRGHGCGDRGSGRAGRRQADHRGFLSEPRLSLRRRPAEGGGKRLQGARRHLHRGGRRQRHQQGAQQRRKHADQGHQLPGLRGGEPRSVRRVHQCGEQERRAGRAVQRQGGRRRLCHLRRLGPDEFGGQARPVP